MVESTLPGAIIAYARLALRYSLPEKRVPTVKNFLLCACLLCLALLILASQNVPTRGARALSVQLDTASASASSIMGAPSLSAAFIDSVLAEAHSPASGAGQALYALSVQYGINDAYALAFFHHESSYGTTGEARVTMSLGNERCIADRPCIDRGRGGYALMNSWADGFQHWYSLLLYGYVQGDINRYIGRSACPCSTVEQIIPVYAPSSDNNNVQAYIAAIERDIVTWRAR